MAYVGVDYLICIQNLYNSKKKPVVLFIFELPYSIQQKKKKTGKQYFVADLMTSLCDWHTFH